MSVRSNNEAPNPDTKVAVSASAHGKEKSGEKAFNDKGSTSASVQCDPNKTDDPSLDKVVDPPTSVPQRGSEGLHGRVLRPRGLGEHGYGAVVQKGPKKKQP